MKKLLLGMFLASQSAFAIFGNGGSWVGKGGGASIGGAVTGGMDGAILLIHPNGTLAQDPTNFNYSPAGGHLTLGLDFINNGQTYLNDDVHLATNIIGNAWDISTAGDGRLADGGISWDVDGDLSANNLTVGGTVNSGNVFSGSLFVSGATTLDDGSISNPGDGSGLWTVSALRVNGGNISDFNGTASIDPLDRFLFDTSNVVSIDWYGRTLSDSAGIYALAWNSTGLNINKQVFAYNGDSLVSPGLVSTPGKVTQANLGTSIADTTIMTSPASVVTLYRYDITLVFTTAGTGGNLSTQLKYTDVNNTVQTVNPLTVATISAGSLTSAQGSFIFASHASGPIKWNTTAAAFTGTPKYSAYATVTRLQ